MATVEEIQQQIANRRRGQLGEPEPNYECRECGSTRFVPHPDAGETLLKTCGGECGDAKLHDKIED